MTRLAVPSTALLWGLQFSLLNPALALLLVALFGATPAQVGAVLAVYNASGFIASLALPAYADRRGDYLRPMLACGVLTLALAAFLAAQRTRLLAIDDALGDVADALEAFVLRGGKRLILEQS